MSTTDAVLNELLDPLGESLTPEVAERIVEIRAPLSVQKRVEELAARCNDGTLSKDEQQEYEALVSAGTFVSILQSKARRLLRARGPS